MSNLNSSLAFQDLEEQHEDVELNLVTRHLSVSNAMPTTTVQPLCQVVKVSGSITISF